VRKVPEPCWCPAGLTKTQRRHLQKLRKKEIDEEKREEARGEWFNKAHPMTKPQMTWREKRLAQEENSDGEEADTSPVDSDNEIRVNMVFELPVVFQVAAREVAELVLGAKPAIFQKPERVGLHMKSLFLKGYRSPGKAGATYNGRWGSRSECYAVINL
jgi:hypothetical protein